MPKLEIFPWSPNFETGIATIDSQHKILVELLNGLAEYVVYQSGGPDIREVFDRLQRYAVFHFETEEKIWRDHFEDDPWLHWHQKSHGDFLAEVTALADNHLTGSYDEVLERIIKFLTHWLAFHILESDRRLAKVVLALPTGISLEKAKELANHEMSGSTKILIDTILTMYDKLANSAVRMSREILKRKRMESDLRQAREAAVAATVAKSELLATISHEIRTPLSAISTMIFMMRRDGVLAAHEEYLGNIELSCKHLLALINNVLDLSKIEAGKLELDEGAVDVNVIARNVTALIADRAREKGLVLDVVSDYGAGELIGDAIRLQQALLNLADNAVKFTEEGAIEIRVEHTAEDSSSAVVRYSVRDSGIGIPAEMLDKLFLRFEQADRTGMRGYGGTGLGLAITRRLAEQMGGDAGVESRPGSGSTFWFSARLGKGKPTSRAAGREASPPLFPRPSWPIDLAPVLVVEDERMSRLMLKRLLESFGLRAHVAASGEEAIKLARHTDYALILMDVQMPRMSGLQATGKLRELARTRDVPIIALTGVVETGGREICLAAGMNGYLTKPLDPERLHEVLLSWVGGTARGQKHASV